MVADVRAETDEPGGRHADRCPYSRSFTPAFADHPECPAYQAATFTVLDATDRPLGPGLTCRHLAVGTDPVRVGRFYPRCGLGDAESRLRWVAAVTPARLAVMRSLEEEFDAATLAARTELAVAKAALVHREADPGDVEDLEMRLSMFLDTVDAFMDERAARLTDVGLPPGRMKQLFAEWSMAWLRSNDVYGPDPRRLEGAGLSAKTAALLGAELRDGGLPPLAPGRGVEARSAVLTITRTEGPRTLHLRGELDVGNTDLLGSALAAALTDGASVIVDFAEVLFCDLSGLRALVRAGQAAAVGQTVEVIHLPGHLREAMRAVGWSDMPGLVIVAAAGVSEANR
jgi:anti-anti-sigma regulatory factor